MTAQEYLRSFWWFVIATPIFGLLALFFGDGLLKVIGMMAILWPFSIPARSILSSSKSARLFTQGCRLDATPERLIFTSEPGQQRQLRMMLEPPTIRDLVDRGAYLLVRMRRLGFVPIAKSAFGEGGEMAFKEMFARMIAERDADLPS